MIALMVDEPSYELSFSLRHVAAVLDGSRASLRTLSVLKDFAQRYGSRITVIYQGSDDEFLALLKESMSKAGITYTVEKPSDLLEFIRIKAPDLLVLPLEGRTGAEALEAAGPILSALAYTESSILVLRY